LIITGDWHLDDSSANTYRWEIFDVLSDRYYHSMPIAILGDMVDRKDRHSASFVNQVVRELIKLIKRNQCEITILRGNHDTAINGPSYFEFLSAIDGIHYISNPYADGDMLWLPSSIDPKKDWAGIPFRNYRCIMMHQTVRGSDFGNGIFANSDNMPPIPRGIRIYSGDVHVPQAIGDVTYVGAPHPVKFGDTHACQLLEVDLSTYKISRSIKLRPIQKAILEVDNLEQLKHIKSLRPGDQVRVRFTIDRARINEWPINQADVRAWAADRGIVLASVEPVVPIPQSDNDAVPSLEADPDVVLDAFAKAEGIDEQLIKVGKSLMHRDATNKAAATSAIHIYIDQIELRCFKSFITPTVINLSQNSGLKYIGGINEVEPSLGANGAGKTSIFDAIFWCFYGCSIHGARTSRLVSVGYDKAEVLVRIRINDTPFELFRSGPPERIAIDGELVDQTAIDKLLQTTKAQALQSLIFGQGVPTFFDMGVPDRGLLFDDVLNLGLWIKSSDRAGKIVQSINRDLVEAKNDLAYAKGILDGLADEQSLLDAETAWSNHNTTIVDQLINELDITEQVTLKNARDVEVSKKALSRMPNSDILFQAVVDVYQQIAECNATANSLSNQLIEARRSHEFYKTNKICPVCRQKISGHFADSCLNDLSSKMNDTKQLITEADQKGQELRVSAETVINRRDAAKTKAAQYQHDIATLEATISANQKAMDRIEQAIQNAMNTTNPYTKQLHDLRNYKRKAASDVNKAKKQEAVISGQLIHAEWWKTAFKRVRLFQLRRVLDSLEMGTAHIAEQLGLSGWGIRFTTEVETKSGGLSNRPGVYINVTSPGEEVAREWSPGELQRVRLAVAIGFAALIQHTSGTLWNMIAFDEPTHWLSQEGIDALLEYLQVRANTTQQSIWLIDHRSLNSSSFAEVWRVTKSAEGSRLELLSKSG
jgi:DNA repair exonuclease SbcCD ATPase subunit